MTDEQSLAGMELEINEQQESHELKEYAMAGWSENDHEQQLLLQPIDNEVINIDERYEAMPLMPMPTEIELEPLLIDFNCRLEFLTN